MAVMRRTALLALALLAPLLALSGPASAQVATNQASSTTSPRITKLLVVVEENHSLAQMKANMPYTFHLAKQYGYATDYHALTHPSLPNYIGIAGGSTYGIRDDRTPAAHQITRQSVFGEAIRHGKTAETYNESMPHRCTLTNSGRYAVRHNPWTYFVNNRTSCQAHDRTMSAFGPVVRAGNLPSVGMVIPNLDHDAHDGSLQAADTWFKSLVATIVAGPDWKSGHLAVVLTADEDDHKAGNTVLTTVITKSLLNKHRVVTTHLTHYSLTRLYDEVAGLPLLHAAADAPSMARAFNLRVS
jgi:phosphatidylinositol-3-phosphatase